MESHMEVSNSSPFVPFVSVVVPAYNERDRIAVCIEAILAQDYPKGRMEVIVVDNNSTDGTDTVVGRYPVTLVYERDMQTPAATRNAGIRAARGEVVALIDGDCKAKPDWLRRLIAPFADASVVGVAGRVQLVPRQTYLETFQAGLTTIQQRNMKGLWYVITGNCAYRREALLKAGLFRANLYTGEDIELGLRLQLQGFGTIAGADDAVVEHPCEDNLRGWRKQCRRYGYSEVLLDTMYRDEPRYCKRPRDQVREMLKQCRSLTVYSASIAVRWGKSTLSAAKRAPRDPSYVAWPALWFVTDLSNLQGKLRGLWATRLFRHLPRRPEQPV